MSSPSLAKQLWGNHPHWKGPILCYCNGRMERPGFDSGSYILEDQRRLMLDWDRWDCEELPWDAASQSFRHPKTEFAVQEMPVKRYSRFPVGRHAGPPFPQRLIVGALSCADRGYQHRRERCKKTWVPTLESKGVEVLFLVGVGTEVNAPTIVGPEVHGRIGTELWLPCPDDYRSLPQKTIGFCRWAVENRPFDYLFKCDDDTYIVPSRLLDFNLSAADYAGFDWFGNGINEHGGYASGGAGYFLSRRAAAAIGADCDAKTGNEDTIVGQHLGSIGIPLRHDHRFVPFCRSEEDIPGPSNDLITSHASDVLWNRHTETWRGCERLFSKQSAENWQSVKDVALLLIATDKYRRFLEPLIASARKHFFPGRRRTYYVFSDQKFQGEDVVYTHTPHRRWPEVAHHKMHILLSASDKWSNHEFVMYLDADAQFIGDVGDEVLGSTTTIRHPCYYNRPRSTFPYETSTDSTAAIGDEEGDTYYMSALMGGAPDKLIPAFKAVAKNVDADTARGIHAVWYDESQWNRYLVDHPPETALPLPYCSPEGSSIPDRKITMLDKDHAAIRDYDSLVTCSSLGQLGRLGNQMFQYAMLIGVAARNDFPIAIPEDALRGFVLSATRLKRGELSDRKQKFVQHGNDSFRFDARVFEQPAHTDFQGFFQSYKYFKHATDRIRTEFTFPPETQIAAGAIIEQVRRNANDQELVLVHARRGDFLDHPTIHLAFELDYFQACLRHFDEDVFFVVVSDDPSWARRNFDHDSQFHIVEESDPYITLCAASRCDHFICSSSTFSWWMAFLGRHPNKKVVIPSPWYGPAFPKPETENEMSPPEWIRQKRI